MKRTARILVVDDNEASAMVFALALSLAGYEVRDSYSGKQAVAIASEFLPDVAFLDLGIPLMNGFEIAARFRETPGLADVVLIAVTGFSGEDAQERTRAAGFRHHLVKPVEPEVLRRTLCDMGFPPPSPSPKRRVR
ncbi:MAG: response regulator [Planctomycetota bacterium]|jgi:CheY-like chemotaxis protein